MFNVAVIGGGDLRFSEEHAFRYYDERIENLHHSEAYLFVDIIDPAALARARMNGIPTVLLLNELTSYKNLRANDWLELEGIDYIACCSIRQKAYLLEQKVPETKLFIVGNQCVDIFKSSKGTSNEDTDITLIYNSNTLEHYITGGLIESLSKRMNRKGRLHHYSSSRILYSDSEVLNRIEGSYAVVVECIDHLIYPVLLNKHVIFYGNSDTDLVERYGISIASNLETLSIVLKHLKNFKFNITENQLTNFLVDFLPATFDGRNFERLCLILNLAIQTSIVKKKTDEALRAQFISKYPTLSDPLYYSKEEALLSINNNNRL